MTEWITYTQSNSEEKGGRPSPDDRYFLHEQSINLCLEDLSELYHAQGLIGIQLDEKRIMGPRAIAELAQHIEAGGSHDMRYSYAKAVWANLFCAVDALRRAGISSPAVWELFAIGSDFDGLINHLDSFESSAKLPELRLALTAFLEDPEPIYLDDTYILRVEDLDTLKYGCTNEALVDNLFSANALRFLERNF